jgi:hypothetical protein
MPMGNGYVLKLVDITVPSSSTPYGVAVIEIYDPSGQKVKEDRIPAVPGSDLLTWTAPDGTKFMIKVYKATPGYTLSAKWAEIAIYSDLLELQDGERIANSDWVAKIVFKNKEFSSSGTNDATPDVLHRIVLVRMPVASETLEKGRALPIIDVMKWKGLRFDGTALVLSDWTAADENPAPSQLRVDYRVVRILPEWPDGKPVKGAYVEIFNKDGIAAGQGAMSEVYGFTTEEGVFGARLAVGEYVWENGKERYVKYTPHKIVVGIGGISAEKIVEVKDSGDIVVEMPKGSGAEGNYELKVNLKRGWNLVPFINPPDVMSTTCGSSLFAGWTYSPLLNQYLKLNAATLEFTNYGEGAQFSSSYGSIYAPASDGKTYSPVFGGMWLYSTDNCKVGYEFNSAYLPGGSGTVVEQKLNGTEALLYIQDARLQKVKEVRGVPGYYEEWTTPTGEKISIEIVGADADADGMRVKLKFNGQVVDDDPVKDGITELDLAGSVHGEAISLGSDKYWVRTFAIGGKTSRYPDVVAGGSMPYLVKGWNFLAVLPWMKDKSWDEVKGSCEVEKAYTWNANRQQWEGPAPPDFNIPASREGSVLVLKARETCQLGAGSSSIAPPALPG